MLGLNQILHNIFLLQTTLVLNSNDPLAPQIIDEVGVESIKEIDEMACRICLAEHLAAPISLFHQFEDDETVGQMINFCTSLDLK